MKQPLIIVSGPKQSGKTSLLRSAFDENYSAKEATGESLPSCSPLTIDANGLGARFTILDAPSPIDEYWCAASAVLICYRHDRLDQLKQILDDFELSTSRFANISSFPSIILVSTSMSEGNSTANADLSGSSPLIRSIVDSDGDIDAPSLRLSSLTRLCPILTSVQHVNVADSDDARRVLRAAMVEAAHPACMVMQVQNHGLELNSHAESLLKIIAHLWNDALPACEVNRLAGSDIVEDGTVDTNELFGLVRRLGLTSGASAVHQFLERAGLPADAMPAAVDEAATRMLRQSKSLLGVENEDDIVWELRPDMCQQLLDQWQKQPMFPYPLFEKGIIYQPGVSPVAAFANEISPQDMLLVVKQLALEAPSIVPVIILESGILPRLQETTTAGRLLEAVIEFTNQMQPLVRHGVVASQHRSVYRVVFAGDWADPSKASLAVHDTLFTPPVRGRQSPILLPAGTFPNVSRDIIISIAPSGDLEKENLALCDGVIGIIQETNHVFGEEVMRRARTAGVPFVPLLIRGFASDTKQTDTQWVQRLWPGNIATLTPADISSKLTEPPQHESQFDYRVELHSVAQPIVQALLSIAIDMSVRTPPASDSGAQTATPGVDNRRRPVDGSNIPDLTRPAIIAGAACLVGAAVAAASAIVVATRRRRRRN